MDRAPETLAGVATKGEPETPAVAAAASLATALDTLATRLGPDLSRWTYSRAHRARFRHALSPLDGRARWEPATVAMDGDNATPSVGPSRLPWSTEVGFGPVYRHVADLADTTMSWGIVPPRNSAGTVAAREADLLTRWAAHGVVPFLLDRARIEREAAERLVLTR
jgi:penicillin amidase